VTEEVAFLGPRGQRILAFLHRPGTRDVNGGVVVCSSLYEDLHVNYRSELLVAKELARRGYAVVRFHYRGTANSDDLDDGRITFDTMVADARTAMTWLAERTGAARFTICGSRLGGLVATELAGPDEQTQLVLWAPIVIGADFFRGMSRAGRLADVRTEARQRQARGDDEPSLARNGGVEMLGNLLHPDSREDLGKRSLPPTVRSGRRVLLIQLGMGEADNPHYRDLASRWTAEGAVVDLLKVRMRQLWMVPDRWEPEEESPTTRELIEGIGAWVAATQRDPA